jgi:two-component system response regulator PilR (NtrC family)
VRELENLLHRALALSDGSQLQVDSRPPPHRAACAGEPAPAGAPASRHRRAQRPAGLRIAGARDPVKALRGPGFNGGGTTPGPGLRQIRYRIARLGIATPRRDV